MLAAGISSVACDRVGISWMESEVVVGGGCRIGPFLIQCKISVIDDTCSALTLP